MIKNSTKTGWFHLIVVLIVTFGAVFAIKQALAKPFVQWQTTNEIRITEIEQALDQ